MYENMLSHHHGAPANHLDRDRETNHLSYVLLYLRLLLYWPTLNVFAQLLLKGLHVQTDFILCAPCYGCGCISLRAPKANIIDGVRRLPESVGFIVRVCRHTRCQFRSFCSITEDKANNHILLDSNTHHQMQHQLQLSIPPLALIIPAVPVEYFHRVAAASLVVTIRSVTQR